MVLLASKAAGSDDRHIIPHISKNCIAHSSDCEYHGVNAIL